MKKALLHVVLPILAIASIGISASAQTLTPLGDLDSGATVRSSSPGEIVEQNGRLFFRARMPDVGEELVTLDLATGSTRVLDVNPNGFGTPRGMLRHAGRVWFYATAPNVRRMLFVTDGTLAGTQSIPFPNATPGADVEAIFGFGNGVVVSASDGNLGFEPWFVDATTLTPTLLADLEPGRGPSNPSGFALHQGRLYFRACNSTRRCSLWVTDGTPAGTGPATAAAWRANALQVVNGQLLMVSETAASGGELFRLEGNTLRLLADTNPGNRSGVRFDVRAPVGGLMAFQANNGLWVTDGTPSGTRMVTTAIRPDVLVPLGARVLLWQFGSGQLWVSDGTPAGTMPLVDLRPGGEITMQHGRSAQVPGTGVAVFGVDDRAGNLQLWASDGTVAGTTLLHSVASRGASPPGEFFASATTGKVYFRGTSLAEGTELWETDGTVGGTRVFANLATEIPLGSGAYGACDLLGRTLFTASNETHGAELWSSDGTAAGTGLVVDLAAGAASSRPTELTRLGGVALFAATTDAHGRELWVTDGTAAGTRLLADLEPGPGWSDPFGLSRVDGEIWFTAGRLQRRIWRTDGTPAGTVPVSGELGAFRASDFTRLGARVLFVHWIWPADGGWRRDELWSTDGTPGGAQLVRDLYPGTRTCGPYGDQCANRAAPEDFVVWNDRLWFTANDGVHGREIWSTDGTAAGTTLQVDTTPNGALREMVRFQDRFWCSVWEPGIGSELWVSDGTPAGTSLFADLNPGPGSSDPSGFARLGSRHLLFSADDGIGGREPWWTDGTLAGTRRLADVLPGAASSGVRFLVRSADDHAALGFQGGALLVADDGQRGDEPWMLSFGALATPVEPGGTFAGSGAAPVLRAEDPVFGRAVAVGVSVPAAGTASAVLLGATATRPGAAGRLPIYLDVGVVPQIVASRIGGGSWQGSVTVPNLPALQGLALMLQAVSLPSAGGGGFDVSNGVHWILGR